MIRPWASSAFAVRRAPAFNWAVVVWRLLHAQGQALSPDAFGQWPAPALRPVPYRRFEGRACRAHAYLFDTGPVVYRRTVLAPP